MITNEIRQNPVHRDSAGNLETGPTPPPQRNDSRFCDVRFRHYTKSYFIDLLKALGAMIEEQKDYLTGLDSAIGDSDHGVNLSIGFRDVLSKLPDLVEKDVDVATLLNKSGMSLLAKVGGASGPLYGSFFRKMSGPIPGKNEVTFTEFCAMIKAGVDEIKRLGKAQIGDKTMVDALSPRWTPFIPEWNRAFRRSRCWKAPSKPRKPAAIPSSTAWPKGKSHAPWRARHRPYRSRHRLFLHVPAALFDEFKKLA